MPKLLTNCFYTFRVRNVNEKSRFSIYISICIVQFMIFNGVECFAYLITISNFRWRLLKYWDDTQWFYNMASSVRCMSSIAREKKREHAIERDVFQMYTAMCGMFAASQRNYIYSEDMLWAMLLPKAGDKPTYTHTNV